MSTRGRLKLGESMAWIGALKFSLYLVLCLLNYPLLAQGGKNMNHMYAFVKNASSLGKGEYDYMIVGGGAAGCSLAATLSQKFNVLMLERGGIALDNPNVTFLPNFHIGLIDKTITENFIANGVINGRAKVLGGGTTINAGFYTKATPEFLEKLGWDTKLVNESYSWIEKQLVHWPKFSGWQRAFSDALVEAGVTPFNGFTYDHKLGTKVGGSTFDKSGRRHSAVELLTSANPNKLTVLIHATVQKIVFDTTGKIPKANGVIFKDENGKQHQAFLRTNRQSEVIVSSGTIGSPQLLLLSGIGPKSDLQKLNIPVVLDNQFVGKGIADSPMNSIFIPFKRPVEQSLIETAGITNFGVYFEATSGFSQTRDSVHYRHSTLSSEVERSGESVDATVNSKGDIPYEEFKGDIPYEEFKGAFILSKVSKPSSTGELRLINTNVEDNPSVSFNYFSHPDDLNRCVKGIRLAIKIGQSKHITNYTMCDRENAEKMLDLSVKTSINLIPKHPNNTKSLEQYCRDSVITIWHYYGGCHVGQVVNSEYKVHGVDGLRVLDGSTFTESPGTNPQATVMMMGRYMGLKILSDRTGNSAGIQR